MALDCFHWTSHGINHVQRRILSPADAHSPAKAWCLSGTAPIPALLGTADPDTRDG